MKKVYLIALAVFILLIISTEVLLSRNNTLRSDNKSIDSDSPISALDNSTIIIDNANNSINPLNEKDFVTNYDGFLISSNTNVNEMFEVFPKNSPKIYITTEAWSKITQVEIDELGTTRGFKKNDT